MSTAYILNQLGRYETNPKYPGKTGINLTYGGLEFFLPYGEVTPIPDYSFREVNHAETAALGDDGEGQLVYQTEHIPGQRLARLFTSGQVPVENKDRGIVMIPVTNDRKVGGFVTVNAGVTEDGVVITADVPKISATEMEILRASELATEYKKAVITAYFQSKTERMAGGNGQLLPSGLLKVFMTELNVEDINSPKMFQNTDRALPSMTADDMQKFLEDLAGQVREQVRKEVMDELDAKEKAKFTVTSEAGKGLI